MILTVDQLTSYAKTAGFSGTGLNTIVAIAQAESNGNTTAWNRSDPFGGSFGVLQINGAHILGVDGNEIALSCAYDPQCSFNYAFQLSKNGTDFHDWGTFTNGNYAQFLGNSSAQTVQQSTTPTTTGSPFDAIMNSPLWQWINDPLRLFKLVGGLALIVIAIVLLI